MIQNDSRTHVAPTRLDGFTVGRPAGRPSGGLLLAFACGLFLFVGCGGDSSSTPTTPTPTPTPTNRVPQIQSLNLAPTFGIAQLTTFSFNGSAVDADGDSVSYAWNVAGNSFTGTSGQIVFTGPGDATARLTVTDGKGGSVTDSRSFVVAGMTGTWNGTWSNWVFTSQLTQSGNRVAGTYSDQLGAGGLDTAAINSVDANGNISLRYKQGPFSDFTFTGSFDSTGRRITGVVNGSGYSNTPFTMNRQ